MRDIERDLAESEKLYRLIAENSTDMISKHTMDGVYTYASPACRTLLGYEPEDLIGRTAYDFFHPDDLASIKESHSAVLELPETRTVSYRIRRKDGSYTWFETTSRTVSEANAGETPEIIAVSRDVSWRKRVEEELQRSNERITDILESVSDAFFALDNQRRFTFVSRRAERFLGQAQEELIGTDVLDVFPEAAGSRFYYESQKAAETGRPSRFEALYPPLGAWFEVRVYPSNDGLAIYFQDITKRKRAEEELRDAEERFRSAFDNTPIGMAIVALDGRYLRINRAMREILGYEENEFLSTTYQEITYPEDREVSAEYARRMDQGDFESYSLEKRYVHAEGHPVWVSLSVSLINNSEGEPLYYISQTQDISERKRAEREIRQRALQQAQVAQLGQRALASTDLDSLMDEAVVTISRVLKTEYSGVLKLLPEKQRFLLQAGVGWERDIVGKATKEAGDDSHAGHALVSREPIVFEDIEAETRFTGKRDLLNRGIVSGMYVVIHGQEGPFGVLGTHTVRRREFTGDDVNFVQSIANVIATAIGRHQAEEALEKSERDYRRLFEMANDSIIIYEPESRDILDINDSACEMYRLPKEEFVGKTMKELSLDRQRARRYLETLLSRGSYQNFETIHRRSDGIPLNVVVNSSVIEFGGRNAIQSIVRDVTDSKRAERSLQEMRQAERRRIARDLHDVVLQDLSGALQALQATQLESNGSGEVELDKEIEALRRAVGGLRNAVYDLRIEKEQPFLKSLESLVELNRQMKPERRITLTTHENFPEEIGPKTAVELVRVLQEALANTRNHSNARQVDITLGKKGRELRAAVVDDGGGFDPAEKPDGVGLSGMRERVEALGGSLKVVSEPGKGTSVEVRLPL